MKLKLRYTDILRFLIFLLLLFDVPYIKHIMGRLGLIYVGLEGLIIFFLVLAYRKKKGLIVPVLLLLALGGYLLFTSIINNSGLGRYAIEFLPVVLVCLYFNLIIEHSSLFNITIKKWIIFLTCIVVIDLISIILFPNGLYFGSTEYHASRQINWFLGYKTNRLAYSFPLIVLYTYYLYIERTFKIKHLFLYVVVFLDIYLTDATAASISIFIYLALSTVYSVSIRKKGKLSTFMFSLVSNYKLFIASYIFIIMTVVFLQSNRFVTNIVAPFLGKTITLSNRTAIWIISIKNIKNHLFFGNGVLQATQYSLITGGYANPHNTVLTYLFTGGIIGLLLVSIFFLYCFQRIKKSEDNYFFVLAVYCILFLGITSSTLAFSPFLFLFTLFIYDIRTDRIFLAPASYVENPGNAVTQD